MKDVKGATYKDAQLILKLYDLRREEKLREAREWFFMSFSPAKYEDMLEVVTPGHPHNAHFRMVVSYWDMAASFAVRGPLNADLLLESGGELLGVWAKIGEFIPQFRKELQLPEFLRNIEAVINKVEWAPGRIEWARERIAMARAKAPQPEGK
ncbi:MAG TPA: hypothetical protein VJZ26_06220 [Blastocatellia bacterium]|nr:hypothetical protein [Blastocatellia bacterium]